MNRKGIAHLLLMHTSLTVFIAAAEELKAVKQDSGSAASTETASRPVPAQKERLQIVKPERTAVVELSNTDINRIHCESGEINDVWFSEEKGISVTTDKDNAWIKYRIRERRNSAGDPDNEYVSSRTEFYITCDGEVYTLLAYPVDTPAKGIRLSRGKGDTIKQNISIYEDMALEERAVVLTHKAIKDTLDDSVTVTLSNESFAVTLDDNRSVDIRKVRDIAVDGMGLTLHEYRLSSLETIMIDEKQLMHPSFGGNILALTVMPEDHIISGERPGRFYVVTVGDRGGQP